MIRNDTQQSIIVQHYQRADNPWRRMKGLLGKKTLDPQEGLVITGCNSVHMIMMRFPIDVIFCDHQGQVVGLCQDLKPFQFSPIFWKSSFAIELATGRIKQSNTHIGDQLSLL